MKQNLVESEKNMSKGFSNLFDGTSGSRNKQVSFYHSINDNISRISKKYNLHKNGYFGKPGKNSGVRVIYSSNPISDSYQFFSIISKGADVTFLNNKKGTIAKFNDGSCVTYRLKTSIINSPAVDIYIKGNSKIKTQKIHFIKEG